MNLSFSSIKALIHFESKLWLRNPINFFALGALFIFLWFLKAGFTSNLMINGQSVALQYRVIYLLAFGYSCVSLITTLYTLCLCLERLGAGYLQQNDWLILSRGVSRGEFHFAKLFSVILFVSAFGALSIFAFWATLYFFSGENLYRILWLIFPLALVQTTVAALFFGLRQFLAAFPLFFGFLLVLPIFYVSQLWKYYGGILRGNTSIESELHWIPDFGGVHAFSLGVVQDFFYRPHAYWALINIVCWSILGLALGIWAFQRKRL